MGLLDDAIREHLELKRRHGADPGEVAKQEHEALGPVRRAEAHPAGTAQAEALSPEHEQLLAPDDTWEPEEEPAAEAGQAEAEVEHDAEPEAPPAAEGGPAGEPGAGSRRLRDEPGQETVSFSLSDLEAEEAAQERDDEPPAPEDDEPVRRRQRAEPLPAADVVPADEEPVEEDVLEETPEFLQETPEHDRLWFEQKPPRDFDF
jgi:hypothetical protein